MNAAEELGRREGGSDWQKCQQWELYGDGDKSVSYMMTAPRQGAQGWLKPWAGQEAAELNMQLINNYQLFCKY